MGLAFYVTGVAALPEVAVASVLRGIPHFGPLAECCVVCHDSALWSHLSAAGRIPAWAANPVTTACLPVPAAGLSRFTPLASHSTAEADWGSGTGSPARVIRQLVQSRGNRNSRTTRSPSPGVPDNGERRDMAIPGSVGPQNCHSNNTVAKLLFGSSRAVLPAFSTVSVP